MSQGLLKAAEALVAAFDAELDDQHDWTKRFQSAMSNLRFAIRREKRKSRDEVTNS